MGFYRTGQPASLDRAGLTAFIAEAVAFEMAPEDPLAVDHDCNNPKGHRFVGTCGDVACVYCGRVVWQ